MSQDIRDMVSEAVAHYEQTKLEMLQIEAGILAKKKDWLTNSVPASAASRVADESDLLSARVANQKAKMRLAELKRIAKNIKSKHLTNIIVQYLLDQGKQDVVDEAFEQSRIALDESGFMDAYRL